MKIQHFLKQLKIEFITHNYMRITNAYQCDILIPSLNLIIECDGDFFHCNPRFYSDNYVRFPKGKDKRTAKMVWDRDEIRTRELEKSGYRIIRLWESEIKKMNLNDFENRLNLLNI